MSGDIRVLKSSNWFTGDIDGITEILVDGLRCDSSHYIVTANLECIAICRTDPEFETICINANHLIPDGIGSVLLLRRFNHDVARRIPGIELAQELLKNASSGARLFLFGGKEQTVIKTMSSIKKRYPNIDIVGFHSGYGYDTTLLIDDINKSNVDILMVALGMPKQEKWIASNLDRLNVKLAIGVGGSFDIWSGTAKRAPNWMNKMGLEWLWRVGLQPFARLPRFLRSILVFLRLYTLKQ